jgi:hypothetical protein
MLGAPRLAREEGAECASDLIPPGRDISTRIDDDGVSGQALEQAFDVAAAPRSVVRSFDCADLCLRLFESLGRSRSSSQTARRGSPFLLSATGSTSAAAVAPSLHRTSAPERGVTGEATLAEPRVASAL